MKREKEVPANLLRYLEQHKLNRCTEFNNLDMLCHVPIRIVKMRILVDKEHNEDFRMVIIPAVDVYTTDKAVLKKGFLKRDSLSYFVSGTHMPFPYGHIYAKSGYICLGSIFVPSAVPEMSVTMPLETLFLHNDRNLSHGDSHLHINKDQASKISDIMIENNIMESWLSRDVTKKPGEDIIKNDQIWNLSADVAGQKSLPKALDIMSSVYAIIFNAYVKMNKKGRV